MSDTAERGVSLGAPRGVASGAPSGFDPGAPRGLDPVERAHRSGSPAGAWHGSTGGRISVIIPCYNQARFLADALGSVAAQSEAAAEVIVVDDGSTDDTAAVVACHPEVRYIRQENRGLAAARNTGLHASTGQYLVFLDSDDRLLPDALQAGRTCLERHPDCAFVFGRFRWIAENGSTLPESPVRRHRPADPYQAFLEGNYIGMHATVMYRRAPLLAAGGFDSRLRECEDYELYLRLTRQHPVAEHDTLTAEYRLHGQGLSDNTARMLATVLHVLDTQAPHVAGNPRFLRSLRRGRRAWKDYYGERLLARLRGLAAQRQWRAAWQSGRSLVAMCGARTPVLVLLYSMPDRLRRLSRRLLHRPAGGRS